MFQQKKMVAIFSGVVLVVVGLMFGSQFLTKEQQNEPIHNDHSATVELYYLNANGKLEPSNSFLEYTDLSEAIMQIIDGLYLMPELSGTKVVLPEAIKLQSIAVHDNMAVIDFAETYYDLEIGDEILARASLVWSITSLEEIDTVMITVDENPLSWENVVSDATFTRENLVINGEVSTSVTAEKNVEILYFSNAEGTGLAIERRLVELEANKSKERTVLEHLILGPEEEGLYATIPDSTKINDVTTTSDGVCYVNLSQDFVTKHSGGSTDELLTVYSIVNSLCELDDVEKVQFLIEGERLNEFKGHLDFSKPFEPRELG
ncbi:MAG: GerMN domain-containing protein [Bacillota bacterium]